MSFLKSFWKKLGDKYKKLELYYGATGLNFSLETFIALVFLTALSSSLILLSLAISPVIAVIAFFAIMSSVISIPVSFRNNRISRIDEELSDALKHMAVILKAGGTTEYAFEDISNSDYGPLSKDLKISLKQLREGKSFDEVLKEAAIRSGSLTFLRSVNIIIDAKKAGAGLADVMFAISDDLKDLMQIKRERVSRTMMHVIFLILSSFIISPFIFGFVLSIVCYIGTGISSVSPEAQPLSLSLLNTILTIFLAIQSTVSAMAIGIMRDGKMFKFSVYIPIIILFALIVFEIGKWFSMVMIGGVATCTY